MLIIRIYIVFQCLRHDDIVRFHSLIQTDPMSHITGTESYSLPARRQARPSSSNYGCYTDTLGRDVFIEEETGHRPPPTAILSRPSDYTRSSLKYNPPPPSIHTVETLTNDDRNSSSETLKIPSWAAQDLDTDKGMNIKTRYTKYGTKPIAF